MNRRSYKDVLLGASQPSSLEFSEWEFSTSGPQLSTGPKTQCTDMPQVSASLTLTQQPGCQRPKTYIPEAMIESFMDMACMNVDKTGLIIETLGILVGYQDANGDAHGTHLVFPVQDGTCSHVNDLGIDNVDTIWFLQENLKDEIEDKFGDFKVISWIHTHVRNTKICFSSVDLIILLSNS